MTTVLETERLVLREWTLGDVGTVFELCRDPEVMLYIGDGRPWRGVERARLWLERVTSSYREHGYGRLAVVERAGGEVVGSCGFGVLPGSPETDFGYMFARSAWGRGLATEAARAYLRYGFEAHAFEEVTAYADPRNVSSRRVLEKVGFEYRGLRRLAGEAEDSAFYVAKNPRGRVSGPSSHAD